MGGEYYLNTINHKNMKAIFNNTVIADSDETVEVEGNQYFPPNSVKQEYLEDSDYQTTCPWKGDAHYYNVVVDSARADNAAWYYPEPKEGAENIKGYIAFWNGVEVTE